MVGHIVPSSKTCSGSLGCTDGLCLMLLNNCCCGSSGGFCGPSCSACGDTIHLSGGTVTDDNGTYTLVSNGGGFATPILTFQALAGDFQPGPPGGPGGCINVGVRSVQYFWSVFCLDGKINVVLWTWNWADSCPCAYLESFGGAPPNPPGTEQWTDSVTAVCSGGKITGSLTPSQTLVGCPGLAVPSASVSFSLDIESSANLRCNCGYYCWSCKLNTVLGGSVVDANGMHPFVRWVPNVFLWPVFQTGLIPFNGPVVNFNDCTVANAQLSYYYQWQCTGVGQPDKPVPGVYEIELYLIAPIGPCEIPNTLRFNCGYTNGASGDGVGPIAFYSSAAPLTCNPEIESYHEFTPFTELPYCNNIAPPVNSATAHVPIETPHHQVCCSLCGIPAKDLTFTAIRQADQNVSTSTLSYNSSNNTWTEPGVVFQCFSGKGDARHRQWSGSPGFN